MHGPPESLVHGCTLPCVLENGLLVSRAEAFFMRQKAPHACTAYTHTASHQLQVLLCVVMDIPLGSNICWSPHIHVQQSASECGDNPTQGQPRRVSSLCHCAQALCRSREAQILAIANGFFFPAAALQQSILWSRCLCADVDCSIDLMVMRGWKRMRH
jgi:hypothetical protein